MKDTLEKAHLLSNALVPYIGSMKVQLQTNGDEHSVIRIDKESMICYDRKQLDMVLDGMLLILKVIEKE
jgi:hypothetical protein